MRLAPLAHLSGTFHSIGNGMTGIYQTLRLMRTLADEGSRNLAVRQAAISAIYLTPEKNEFHEAETLFNLVRDCIRYVRDIHGVETLCTPEKTLAQRVGDCDDQTTLLAALLQSVGYQTRFVIAGYSNPQMAEHVYLQVFVNGAWVDCDPTETSAPFGWAPPYPEFLYIEGE